MGFPQPNRGRLRAAGRLAGLVVACAVAAAPCEAAPTFVPPARTISASQQFIVYSKDAGLRGQVASFAEEVKASLLQLLGETDQWKYTIIVTLDRAATDKPLQKPVKVSMYQLEAGFKVEIDVHIGENPAEINLQKHLARAIFLEYAYRDQPAALHDGEATHEAPWWLVEGALQIFHAREAGINADVFKRIIEVNHLPSIESLLSNTPDEDEAPTARAVDQAYAMCLVELLIEQPSGRQCLASYVRHLPTAEPNPVNSLIREFPGLSPEAGGMQKWWTLNLATFSAVDRYKGLSAEETDAELAGLLQFEIPGAKGAPKKSYGIGDFDQYLKQPAARNVLLGKGAGLVALSAHANPLYRNIVGEYEQLVSLLAAAKTHGVKERLARVERYREALLRRRADIADYLNWFEATQMDANEHAFDSYLKAADEIAAPASHSDPITRYLDEISREF